MFTGLWPVFTDYLWNGGRYELAKAKDTPLTADVEEADTMSYFYLAQVRFCSRRWPAASLPPPIATGRTCFVQERGRAACKGFCGSF